MRNSRSDAESTAWRGGVPLPVAALRVAPLRHATPLAERTCTGRIVEFLPKEEREF